MWLCHALNCLPWQSCQSPGRVCSVTWRAFSIPGSFVEKQGDSRGEREIGEATHADFFRAVRRFFLVYFALFSAVSFFLSFFFSKIKSCPNNFIYVFSLRWWISNYDLLSGFKYNTTINEKTRAFMERHLWQKDYMQIWRRTKIFALENKYLYQDENIWVL